MPLLRVPGEPEHMGLHLAAGCLCLSDLDWWEESQASAAAVGLGLESRN